MASVGAITIDTRLADGTVPYPSATVTNFRYNVFTATGARHATYGGPTALTSSSTYDGSTGVLTVAAGTFSLTASALVTGYIDNPTDAPGESWDLNLFDHVVVAVVSAAGTAAALNATDRAGGTARNVLDSWLLQILDTVSSDLRFTFAKRNRAIQQAYDELVKGARPRVQDQTWNLTADQQYYALPMNVWDVLSARTLVSSVETPLYAITAEELDDLFPGWKNQSSGTPRYWFPFGLTHIGLYPKPSTTSGTLRAWSHVLYDAFPTSDPTNDTTNKTDLSRVYDYPLAARAAVLLLQGDPRNKAATAMIPVLQAEWEQAKRDFSHDVAVLKAMAYSGRPGTDRWFRVRGRR